VGWVCRRQNLARQVWGPFNIGFSDYVEPIPFHAEDRLEVLAIYDNSETNPLNPNSPPIPVGWGERTTDEMCIVFAIFRVRSLCGLGLCE